MGLEGLVVVLQSLLHASPFGVEGDDDTSLHIDSKARSSSPSMKRISRKQLLPASYSNDDLEAFESSEEGGVTSVSSSDAVGKFDRKKRIQEEVETGILKFNLNPKKGLAFLVQLGHLEMEPKAVAAFLRQYQDRLDMTVVGEFLGREPEYEQGFCIKVLSEYVDSMDFTNMKFDEAIRFFLSGFRLPGEAQKIDRLMEKFAERYYLQNRQDFASADMAFILAFSTIMLQTNLHNPAIKEDKRMTKDQFIRQNKGISPDGELSDELLSEIYDRISQHPISLNKEDIKTRRSRTEDNSLRALLASADSRRKEAFSDERREMVNAAEALFKQKLQSKLGNSFVHTSSASDEEYVRPMFDVCWAPMIGVFSQVLETSETDRQIELCIRGLRYGVRLAGRLDFAIVRHTYMNALSKFTVLDPTREIGMKNIECVKALVLLALSEGEYLEENWVDVLKCVSQLDRLSLIVHSMKADETSSTSSASSRRNLVRTADKDPLTKLFLGLSKAESMRIIDESNAEMLEDAIDSEDLERIFTHSQSLSGNAVYVFVQSLCTVSLQEINGTPPRVFTLQKIVEVADFNMGSRPRLDWDKIWSLLATHFTTVGVNSNTQLAMYAVDSLKQLSIKFLQKTELANFNFQRKFLKPFEIILAKSPSLQIKDLVVRCLDIMIQACSSNIRSGWRSIFSIFEIAAAEKYEVAALAFEVTDRLIKTQFELLIYDFVELMNCLVAFVASSHSLLSLAAISHVATCAHHLANGDVSQALDAQHNYSDTLNISWEKSGKKMDEPVGEDTSVFRLWWPLLLGLSTRAADPRNEIRVQALETLHKTLCQHGRVFSAQTWNVVFKGVLFPMIDAVLTDNAIPAPSLYPTQHPPLSDAQTHSNSMGYQVLSLCISVFHQHRVCDADGNFILLPEMLSMLEDCICQDTEGIAILGSRSLREFVLGFKAKGKCFLSIHAATLICDRLLSCVSRNLCFDFAQAGAVKQKDDDFLLASALSSEQEKLPAKAVTRVNIPIKSSIKKEVVVRSPYGEGVLQCVLPADEASGLPPRNVIILPFGAILYTTDDLPTTMHEEEGSEPELDSMMYAPELSVDQAWMQLANTAMTNMVVTLDLIQSISVIVEAFLGTWEASQIATLLTALHSCHAYAHAFNHSTQLRINLKLAGFMKFPDNAARLPHLLEQESDALLEILRVTSKLTSSTDASMRVLVNMWFSR